MGGGGDGGGGRVGGGWGGGLLHMYINLDSTYSIITGHKIVAIFFLQRFFFYQLAY